MSELAQIKAAQVWAQLQQQDRVWLTELARLASPARIALVGGAVRDALLGKTPLDLDVVVEGAGVDAVESLAKAAGQPYVFHPVFQNATLTLPDGRYMDLVRSRWESYPVAGQNPIPEPSTLADDLRRRDFSLNALALVLGHDMALLDVTGGLADLQNKQLKPLSFHSFYDDASRLVRGARLAARLGLTPHPQLLAQVPDALAVAHQTPRLWAELKLMLFEPRPYRVAQLLGEWGAGELLPDLQVIAALDQLQSVGETVTPQTFAAGLLARADHAPALAQRLSLGDKPAALLGRARSDSFFPVGTPEIQLRHILRPDAYVPLTGKDVLALGVPAGRAVGQALAHLAELRQVGQVKNQTEEREALQAFIARQP